MRKVLWIVLILFLFLPTVASAEILELVCVSTEGYTINCTVDTAKNTVSTNGILARSVNINETSISFVFNLDDGEHFFRISRSNGNMSVRDPSGYVITGYHCDKAIKKF